MSVVRTLKNLKDEKIIEDDKGFMQIKDKKMLQQISLKG
jgi:hypothetical protein